MKHLTLQLNFTTEYSVNDDHGYLSKREDHYRNPFRGLQLWGARIIYC